MHRRALLKNLTFGLGYVAVTPALLNLMASCGAKEDSWKPLFFSSEEKHIVKNLVDIIIPASDTPGALDVNVPQFIDLLYHDIKTEEEKSVFKEGAALFSKQFVNTFDSHTIKGTKENFETLLSTYFNLSTEDSEAILEHQNISRENFSAEDLEQYTVYNFLLSVRYYSIFGYITSEKIGEHVLAYDPIPGTYKACISVEEATKGRAWSL